MPYVESHIKNSLDGDVHGAMSVGELTYEIQQLLQRYLRRQGVSYQNIMDAHSACHGAAKDLWDRVGRPYEEKKRCENGDVWGRDILAATICDCHE